MTKIKITETNKITSTSWTCHACRAWTCHAFHAWTCHDPYHHHVKSRQVSHSPVSHSHVTHVTHERFDEHHKQQQQPQHPQLALIPCRHVLKKKKNSTTFIFYFLISRNRRIQQLPEKSITQSQKSFPLKQWQLKSNLIKQNKAKLQYQEPKQRLTPL